MHVQGADSAQGALLPACLPCMVSASLSSLASGDIMLQSVRLEPSSPDTGVVLLPPFPLLITRNPC